MLIKMETGASGGNSGVYIQRGKPSSNIIQCGFRASKVYLSDPAYNISHRLIRSYDYALYTTQYIQSYDDHLDLLNNSGSSIFIELLGETSVTLESSLVSSLSDNAVIMVCE